jgi:glycosyltransferase involved in cell wall biosynthesis
MRNKAKSVLNVAQHCVDFLTEHGVSPGKLEVVHNGIVDLTPVTDKRDAIRSEWGFTNKHTLIGAASRLDPVKGLEYLIKAFALISDKFPDAQLVILGDGTLREALENQAEQLKISDRVLFTGMRNDIPDCLNALDIFALPSLAEYHSIGLLEAMRAGLPIIATDVGGNTESVRDEQEGLIVESSNANQFSDALIRLLGDEELSSKFANAARKRFLEEFTEDAMLKKTAAWLEKVCSN